MKRWDVVGGIFLRVGRWWIGLVRDFPYLCRVPLIAGGTEATSTNGAYIEIGMGGSPMEMKEVDECVNIGGPNPDSEELDATHLRSPARTREYIQSFLTPGECPITVNWIPSKETHQRLMELYASGETVPAIIHYPTGDTDAFDFYVKNRPTTFNVGEVQRKTFTLRVTGEILYTAPGGSPA